MVRRPPKLPLVAAVAVAAAATGCGEGHRGGGFADPPTGAAASVVTVDVTHPGAVVPRSFLGFSVEWDSIRAYTGPAGARRAALRRLLAPLVRATGGLALRVGGDTADQAWWDPTGRRPRPAGVLQTLTSATVRDVAWLARALGGPVTLDVNLASGDPGNAAQLVGAARTTLPAGSLEEVEIGNEPDLYTRWRVFRVPGHVHVRERKAPHYTPADYQRDMALYLRTLSGALHPTPPFGVAGFAGPSWVRSLGHELDAWGPAASVVSAHLYALPRCGGSAPPVSWLLSARASRGRVVAALGPLAAVARAHHRPWHVTELNSAACGGRAGLSDRPAAAVWLADTLFALVRAGAGRAHVHTWARSRYAPFAVAGAAARARAPLGGMLAFARAAPPASRLVATRVARPGGLRAWATVDAARTLRVALLGVVPTRARVDLGGRRCFVLWRTTGAHVDPGHGSCTRARSVTVALPARSIAVLTAPAGG